MYQIAGIVKLRSFVDVHVNLASMLKLVTPIQNLTFSE